MAQKKHPNSPPAQAVFEAPHDILMDAPIGVYTSTPEGQFLAANAAMASMFGYESPENLISTVTDIGEQLYADPADREFFKRQIEQHGEVKDQEFKMVRRDDSLIWVSRSGRGVKDSDGNITQYQGFITDITERKIAEEKTSKSHQTLMTILESLPADVYVSDLHDHTVLYMNKSMKRSFGRDCTGELCHEVFNNTPSPCSHCKKPKLLDDQNRPTGIVSWEWYNPIAKKWYINEDQAIPWNGEKFVHIQLATDITERKRAEVDLHEKTQLLQNITDTMTDLVSVTDMEGNYKFIGPSHSILGYDLDALLGRNVMEFVHLDDYQRVATAFGEFLINREDGKKVEYRYRRNDGTYLWFETIGKFILDEQGVQKEILFSTRDTTDRKQAEGTLAKQKQIMAQAEELAELGSWEWDIRNDTWLLSDNWKRIHGVPDIQLTTHQLIPIAHPEDRPAIEEAFAKAVGDGKPYDIEHRIVRQDNGEVRHVHAKGIVEFDVSGKPKALVGAAQDITERKKAEESLLESEKRFRSLFEHSPIAYQSLAEDGRYIDVNDRLCELLGYTRLELLGTDFGELWSERTRHLYPETFEEF
jgi:PAS domain S-box-containing protein